MRTGVVFTAVGSLMAAAVGCYIGWHGSTVEPKPPAAVCPVVRAELLDRLIPKHKQYDEPFGGEGYAGVACVVKGPKASADLAVMHFGRRRGKGPIASAQDGMFYFLNRRRFPIQLGDEAWYLFKEPQGTVTWAKSPLERPVATDPEPLTWSRHIYVVVRVGATVIQVIYGAELGEEAMITSGQALAEEVLASL